MKKGLPNVITLINLLCGCCAIVLAFEVRPRAAFYFFCGALAADYLDGLAARLLRVSSDMGKQLDALADMVSFGLLPGVAMYLLMNGGQANFSWGAIPAFIITLFSALRLGKFNLDTRQTDNFIGLPTPACAIFCMGLLLAARADAPGFGTVLANPWTLYPIAGALAYLLVAEIPMFSLKFKHTRWKGNEIKFIFAGAATLLLVLFQTTALPLIVLLYILISIFSPKRSS
jgi:CDP-diacylglycerol--serine O-phosphatidyltransferase